MNLAAETDRARLAVETDRLRVASLTSISHDLRTPLASILGSATSLISHGCEFDRTIAASLLRTIQEEAERLNRFIGNLLDMTRLESSAYPPERTGRPLRRHRRHRPKSRQILQNHQVEIALEPNLPMVRTDMVLLEQVMFNLLDNAAKYAPEGSRIEVAAARENGFVAVRVLDEGDGIPEADLERIFDKFYRVRRGDRQRAGTGLGLAICRGFIEAMEAGLPSRTGPAGRGRFLRSRFRPSSVAPPPATLP